MNLELEFYANIKAQKIRKRIQELHEYAETLPDWVRAETPYGVKIANSKLHVGPGYEIYTTKGKLKDKCNADMVHLWDVVPDLLAEVERQMRKLSRTRVELLPARRQWDLLDVIYVSVVAIGTLITAYVVFS
jgi:hypothetical protein